MSDPKVKLIKWGADWCGPCTAMKRARTLEKFVEKHPNIELSIVDVDTKSGEDLAYDYEIDGIPHFIFESDDGSELVRLGGATTINGLEKLYEKALKNLETGKLGKVRLKKKRKAKADPDDSDDLDEDDDLDDEVDDDDDEVVDEDLDDVR